jgi:hypothetical protein
MIIPATRNQGVIAAVRAFPSDFRYPLFPNPHLSVELSSLPIHLTNTAQNVSIDFEVPYYSPYNQLLPTNSFPDGMDTFQTDAIEPTLVQIALSVDDTTTLPQISGSGAYNARFMVALGDDFKMSFLVAPPDLYYYQAQV